MINYKEHPVGYTLEEAREILGIDEEIWEEICNTSAFAGTTYISYRGLIKAKVYQLSLALGTKGEKVFCEQVCENLVNGKELYHYPPSQDMDFCHIKFDLEQIRNYIDKRIEFWHSTVKKPPKDKINPYEKVCKEYLEVTRSNAKICYMPPSGNYSCLVAFLNHIEKIFEREDGNIKNE